MSSDAAGSARWLRWAFRYQSKRSLMASMVWVSWRPRLNSPRAGGYLVISSQWKITRAITWTTLCEQVDNEPSPDRNSPRSPELIGARSIAPGFRGFLQQIRQCGGPSGHHNVPNPSCSRWKNAAIPSIGLRTIGQESPSSESQRTSPSGTRQKSAAKGASP